MKDLTNHLKTLPVLHNTLINIHLEISMKLFLLSFGMNYIPAWKKIYQNTGQGYTGNYCNLSNLTVLMTFKMFQAIQVYCRWCILSSLFCQCRKRSHTNYQNVVRDPQEWNIWYSEILWANRGKLKVLLIQILMNNYTDDAMPEWKQLPKGSHLSAL